MAYNVGYGLMNYAMNAEDTALHDSRFGYSPVLDISDSEDFINPEENTGLLTQAAVGALGTYGTALTAKHGLRYGTPVLQRLANPLQKASTRIEGYYNPKALQQAGQVFKRNIPQFLGGSKTQTKIGKVNLLGEHWWQSDKPALSKYLEEVKKTGIDVGDESEAFKKVQKFYKGPKGAMFGIGAGRVETADEFLWAERMEQAEQRLGKALDIDNPDDIKKYRSASTKAKNMLRYEMQKTELIKHSFGKKVNKARWKASGLGELRTTTLEGALGGNTRAIRAWINDSKISKFLPSSISEGTKVTVSQYTGADHRTLISGAKKYGSTWLKQDVGEALGKVLGYDRPLNRVRVNGIFDIAKDTHRLYEMGEKMGLSKVETFETLVTDHVNRIRNNLTGNRSTLTKSNEMLDQFLKNHDFVNGRTKVNYSFLSTQQTVAGVNADIEIFRGKPGLGARSATIAGRTGPGVGKLHHKVLVSDLYDVAGGAGTVTQKNLHMNVAHQDSRPGRNKMHFKRFGRTRKDVLKALKGGDMRTAMQLMPKLTKKTILRLARLAILKR